MTYIQNGTCIPGKRLKFHTLYIPSTSTKCGLITPVTRPILDLLIHLLCRILIHTASPIRYCPWKSCSLGLATVSKPVYGNCWYIKCWPVLWKLRCCLLALHYTTSGIEHCFLVAIVFTLLWILSTIPFPAGLGAVHASLAGKCWLVNAVPLSAKISISGPHS